MTFSGNSILEDREKRAAFIHSFIATGKTVVSLHANIPGPRKDLKEAYVLIGLIEPALGLEKIMGVHSYEGNDGPCRIFVVNDTNYTKIKEKMVLIEEEHPLGRYVDLDVFGDEGPSLHRKAPRTCYLCGKPAFVCGRAKTHNLEELIAHITEKIVFYLRDEFSFLLDRAILDELDLDPKFGLVTPTSRGSHPDMDYELMKEAKNAIRSHFETMFFIGYFGSDPDRIFTKIRQIGLFAEKSMLAATHGINAYKGLIFSLGLVSAATGYAIANHLPFASIFQTIQYMTKDLLTELSAEKGTFGLEAFQKYHFGGARKEAFDGFPSVRKALPLLEPINKENLTMTLIDLIKNSEDTVLLKRAGSIERYRTIKEKIGSITEYDIEKVAEVTRWCIEKNASFGGSADLLVVTSFLKRVSSLYQFSAEQF
jgi:holo-ACP synthase CitX